MIGITFVDLFEDRLNRFRFTRVIARTDRQTDGHTDIFFADSASLGIYNQLFPWKHIFFPRVTKVDLNL